MSTRGLYGFRKNDTDKMTYNHFDSYPDWLGRNFAEFIKRNSIVALNRFYDRIELIDASVPPTDEQKKKAKAAGYYNGSVSEGNDDDWYCLLRNLQGDFDEYSRLVNSEDTVMMEDNSNFIKDSLMCEYAYIFNLDTNCLEFYVGFQKAPCETNRYGTEGDKGYYPCKMILEIPYMDVVNTSLDDIVAKMEQADADDYNKNDEESVDDEQDEINSEIPAQIKENLEKFGLVKSEINDIFNIYKNEITENTTVVVFDNLIDFAKKEMEDLYNLDDYGIFKYIDLSKFANDAFADINVSKLSTGRVVRMLFED